MWTESERESPAPSEVVANPSERRCAPSPAGQALQEVLGDLQTPVALLELSLGFLAEAVEPHGAQARSALRDARHAARRIQRYIDQFVNAEVAGRAAPRASHKRVDIDAMVRMLLDDYESEARGANTPLRLESDVAMLVRGEEALIERAFQTLIETALDHAYPGQVVSLRLSSGSVVCVDVSIAGPAREEHDLELDRPVVEMRIARRARRPRCGFEDCEIAFRRLAAVVSFERRGANRTEIRIQLPAATI